MGMIKSTHGWIDYNDSGVVCLKNGFGSISKVASKVSLFLILGLFVTTVAGCAGESIPGEAKDYGETARVHEGEKRLGNPEASVTVVEYLDFECGYCARQAQQTFPRLLEDYIAEGTVEYEIRHFPLGSHEHARAAANASECALDQGAFWEFKQLAFQNQDRIDDQFLLQLAEKLPLDDPEQYRSCVQNGANMERVEEDKQSGQLRRVEATPTMYVDGEELEGAVPYRQLDQAIQEALNEED